MMIIVTVALAWLLSTFALWVQYLAVMRLQEVRDAGKLPDEAMPFAKTVLYVGLLWDCFYNLTWASIIFLDLPRELLVTQRLERYRYSDGVAPWRIRLTEWFSRVLLDPFDPSGLHVKP